MEGLAGHGWPAPRAPLAVVPTSHPHPQDHISFTTSKIGSLADGVFELLYTCSGAGAYLLHLWHRDKHGVVHEMSTSPQALVAVHRRFRGGPR